MQTTPINSMKQVFKLHNYTNDQLKQIIKACKLVWHYILIHLTNLNNKRERQRQELVVAQAVLFVV